MRRASLIWSPRVLVCLKLLPVTLQSLVEEEAVYLSKYKASGSCPGACSRGVRLALPDTVSSTAIDRLLVQLTQPTQHCNIQPAPACCYSHVRLSKREDQRFAVAAIVPAAPHSSFLHQASLHIVSAPVPCLGLTVSAKCRSTVVIHSRTDDRHPLESFLDVDNTLPWLKRAGG
ncbi:hypothetical protein F4803DRAFT_514221 [Xylaria telfairii]|nr:hypothetical protein F4803DRAFT_514221 [Xylaria telfairii]